MINPVGHRVLIRPDEVEKTTPSGIILAVDERIEKSNNIKGTLVAVGSQAWKAFDKEFKGEPWAKVGDHIIYSKHSGSYVEDPDTSEILLMANDEDVVAVITA